MEKFQPLCCCPSDHVLPDPIWNSGNFRAYPFHRKVQNRYCEFLMDRKKYADHRKRVARIQPTVDNKITFPSNIADPSQKHLPDASISDVDLTCDIMDQISRLFGIYSPDHRITPKLHSLNSTKRNEELRQITLENQAIYRRLIGQRTCYPQKCWEDNWKLHEERLARISKFPNEWRRNIPGETKNKITLPPIITKENFKSEKSAQYSSKTNDHRKSEITKLQHCIIIRSSVMSKK